MPEPAAPPRPLTPASAQQLLISALSGHEGPDPYPAYHRLRADTPVLAGAGGIIALTRFADCDTVFRSRSLGLPRDPMTGWPSGRRLSPEARRKLSWLTRTMMMR